jgi:hypothetical protein
LDQELGLIWSLASPATPLSSHLDPQFPPLSGH